MANGDHLEEAGSYLIVRQIGSGGMGGVFEAVDTRLGHRVALKRLHPHVAARTGAAARFLREGRAAARVRHPHVVQVFALGEGKEGPYLAMELLDGRDLAAALAEVGRLSVGDALELLLPVIAAVGAAHDAGVIHRDLKPSNVFVSRGAAGRPWPKVIDFGVSKVLCADQAVAPTMGDAVLGTAAYMAPEQADSVRNASFQSDQYALAVVLYQCLTGVLPFSGANEYELVLAITTAPVTPPSHHVRGLPPELDEIVLRAMHRNPAARFPSVRAFGAALLSLARDRERAAWGAELSERPQGWGVRAVAESGGSVLETDMPTAATLPPTARDTRASVQSRRKVTGIVVAIAVAGTAVAGVALSTGRSRLEIPPPVSLQGRGEAVPEAQGTPPSSPGGASASVRADLDAVPSARPAASVASRGTGAPVNREPLASPRRTTPTTPSAPLPRAMPTAFGDNGAPILP
jgi:tRNA A-37 threonylcarbamoyl transferase component Bud32